MKKLYHYPICPLSRQIRVYLKEIDVGFGMIKIDYWKRYKDFLRINPAGTLPVLEESFGLTIPGIYPITEYLNEKYPNFNFMDDDSDIKCEIRRLLSWFNEKFYREVTKILIDEKVVRLMSGAGTPRTEYIRAAKVNLTQHLIYLSDLLETRSFVGSENISCADIAASCHLSVIDYFGEIHWDSWPLIKNWYSSLKSRPSFRALLQDQIPGFTPSITYADLDF